MQRAHLLTILVISLSLAALGCGDSASAVCKPDNLNHPFVDSALGIELVLNHNCSSGAVTGDLYDPQSFRYDLTGTVENGQFNFSATRTRPSGDSTDTYSSGSGGIEILNRGITLRGVVFLNSISIGDETIFRAQAE